MPDTTETVPFPSDADAPAELDPEYAEIAVRPPLAQAEVLQEVAEANHPLLQGLNAVQRAAVLHGDGPLLLFAGAGSGKTRVLTHRVAYLIAARNVLPRHILAVTFTNKAAQEMKERINRLVGDNVGKHLWVGTFHALCARLLREFGEKIGIDRDFVVYDDADQITLLKECLRQLNIDEKKFAPRAILSRISHAKEKLVGPEDWHKHFSGFMDDIAGRVYPVYHKKLRDNNALDFDDLLTEAVNLLQARPEVLERLQNRYRYILVDEYQDVNHVQYMLLKHLADRYKHLCVVGDDDQSVYGWRGADVRLILQFEHDYPDATVMKLEQNYRSTKNILDAAYGVVRNNKGRKDKKLWTENEEGVPLVMHEAENEQEEAAYIAQKVRQAVKEGGQKWSNYAVLYRTNAQSRVLEEMFRNWYIPHKLIGGVRFYERKEIKDIMAYLRVIQNPVDSVALRRIINVPARGIGQSTFTAIEEEMLLSGRNLWQVVQHIGNVSAVGRAGAYQTGRVRQPDRVPPIRTRPRHRVRGRAEGDGQDRLSAESGGGKYPRIAVPIGEPGRTAHCRTPVRVRNRDPDPFRVSRTGVPCVRHRQPGRQCRSHYAHDASRRQGVGVRDRIPRRHGGGRVPTRPLHGKRQGVGGGAPPVLRGHHAGQARGVSQFRQSPYRVRQHLV